MKRRSLFSLLTLVVLIMTCFSTTAGTKKQTVMEQQTGTAVVISETGPIVDPNSPRTPTVIPCSCIFYDTTETLCFTFFFPVGDVTITLTEESAGVVSSSDYSTSSGFVNIPVPGPGNYEICILLESGTEYTGQFVYL